MTISSGGPRQILVRSSCLEHGCAASGAGVASYWSNEIRSFLGPCASDAYPVKAAATSAACKERFPVRTMEQIGYIPVPPASASQVIGSLSRLDESDEAVYHTKSVRNRLLWERRLKI